MMCVTHEMGFAKKGPTGDLHGPGAASSRMTARTLFGAPRSSAPASSPWPRSCSTGSTAPTKTPQRRHLATMTAQTPPPIDPAHRPVGMFPEQLERVEPHLGPLAEWLDTLRHPKRCLIVDVVGNGWTTGASATSRASECSTTRPAAGQGGVRFHPDVTLSEVMAPSAWMTVKNARLSTVPYGGAKGGAWSTRKTLSRLS